MNEKTDPTSKEVIFSINSARSNLASGPVTLVTSSALASGDTVTYALVRDEFQNKLGTTALPKNPPPLSESQELIEIIIEEENKLGPVESKILQWQLLLEELTMIVAIFVNFRKEWRSRFLLVWQPQ